MTIKNNSSCAVFLTADPLTKAEIQVVMDARKIYQNVDIVLDRKSRENIYLLSYNDRADIIKHDFKQYKIDDYQILPNDDTLSRTLKKLQIKTLVIGVSMTTSSKILSKVRFMHKLSEDLNVVAIPIYSSCSKEMIQAILNDPLPKDVQEEQLTEYAYMKAKVKTTVKIGLTGEDPRKSQIVLTAFADKANDFEIVNLDILQKKDWMPIISEAIRQNSGRHKLVIYTKKLYQSKLDEFCDSIVYIYSNELSEVQKEQMTASDMYIDARGDEKSVFRNAVNLINHRLKI